MNAEKPSNPKPSAERLTSSLARLIQGTRPRSNPFASGSLVTPMPRIEARGVGPLSLPVPDALCEPLSRLPIKAIQIDAARWSPVLAGLISAARASLGVNGEIRAELARLVASRGGRIEIPKAPGAFGVLLIALPSWGEGRISLRGSHEAHEIKLSHGDPSELSWVAAFADCELTAVSSGYRVFLVYHLLSSAIQSPHLPAENEEYGALQLLLSQWSERSKTSHKLPTKVSYLLSGRYDLTALSFSALEGKDALAASLLREASEQAGCELFLAVLSSRETGSAINEGSPQRDSYRKLEVLECSRQLSGWVSRGDKRLELPSLEATEGELSPPGAIDEEGAVRFSEGSYEETSQRAVLVIWPGHKTIEVLTSNGMRGVLPFLEWRIEGKAGAKELAAEMSAQWPSQIDWQGDRESKMLSLLLRLGEPSLVKRFVQEIIAKAHYSGAENHAIARSYAVLGNELFSIIETLLRQHLRREPLRCSELFAALAEKSNDAAMQRIALLVVKELSQPHHEFEGITDRRYISSKGLAKEPALRATFVVNVMRSLWRLQLAPLAEEAADAIISSPQRFSIDDVLIDAVIQLKASAGAAGYQRLYDACFSHLKMRIAAPLDPPSDWGRPAQLSCSCRDCRELKSFLLDPVLREWRFKASVSRRDHVAQQIERDRCDASFVTLKKSSPYILLCTKTNQLYAKLCQQRSEDLKRLEQLSLG